MDRPVRLAITIERLIGAHGSIRVVYLDFLCLMDRHVHLAITIERCPNGQNVQLE